MEVKINREIRNYTEAMFFGLSMRQFIFSACACVVAVGLYFLLKPYVGTETVSWMCILGAAPFAALGFIKYNGMTAEKFVWAWFKSEFLMPKKLTFRSTNTYYEMMKPGMGSYDRFKELFDTYSKQAGKEQYLIPYFISAHPGTRDEDMVNLALWLKKHRFRLDQVQNFYPSPLANSTTMYYTGKNPLGKIGYKSEEVVVPKGDKQRRLHKALLRYHDPANWPLIRQALEAMGKKHLIGSRRDCLVPAPTLDEMREARRQNRHTRPALTKHTPIAHQRQTPAAAGAKKRVKPKAVSR